LGCIPLLALYQVLEGLPNSLVLLHKLPEYLFNGTQDSTISGDYSLSDSGGVGYTLLLECDVPGTDKGAAMKKKIILKIIIISIIINYSP